MVEIIIQLMSLSKQERALLPTQTIFEYTGRQRYLQLGQYLKTSSTQQILQSHSIIDEQLSIILKRKKQTINLPNTPPYQIQPQFINQVKQHNPPVFFQNIYLKYVELDDFIFGREHWGRNVNCLRIHSDLISRLHARLSVNTLSIRQSKQELLSSLKTIVDQSHYSSSLRKISKELWNKLAQYAQQCTRYTLRDCGSRNGTFLINYSQDDALLKMGEGYEFQGKDYIIYVNQILHISGAILSQRITAFQQHFKSQQFYNPRHSYKIICRSDLLNNLASKEETVQAIYFQVDFSHQLKYFFWVVTTNQQESYSFGEEQTIAISASTEQLTYESGRHGSLILKDGQWRLHHAYAGERVWVKLAAQKDYELNPSIHYRIRLGHLHIIDLFFRNF